MNAPPVRAAATIGPNELPATRRHWIGSASRTDVISVSRLALLSIWQVEASLVDLTGEIRLVPEWIAARDDGNGAHAPRLLGHLRQPLERACGPRISQGSRPCSRSEDSVDEKTSDSGSEDDRTHRRDKVQPLPTEAFGVSEDPTWHTAQARQVHRQEGEIETCEHQPERASAEALGQAPARDKGIVVVRRRQEAETACRRSWCNADGLPRNMYRAPASRMAPVPPSLRSAHPGRRWPVPPKSK